MVEVVVGHDVLDDILVLLGHVDVNRFHEAGKLAVQCLDLLLVHSQQAFFIEEEVLCRI
jgi:hypothetical protein